MKPQAEYDTNDPLKASFKIKTDTNTWEFVQKSSPYIETVFDLFTDLEALELQFIRPTANSGHAFLSHVPRAWVRVNGEIMVYKPDDDAYGMSGYILEIGDQMSPLPLSTGTIDKHTPKNRSRFSLLITSSACLVRDPEAIEEAFDTWNVESFADLVELSGFTSRVNPGGSMIKRLHAQMNTVCEILAKELDMPVEFEKIRGILGEK